MTTDPHDATVPEDLQQRYDGAREVQSDAELGGLATTIVNLIERIAAAEKRAADAEAQVMVLSRPVHDEEAQKYADYMDCEGWYDRFRFTPEQVTALIAARLSSAKGGNDGK